MSKERPILFNAEMVRAILEGRKTQTRRIMQQQPPSNDWDLVYVVSSTQKKLEGKRHWVRLNETKTCELERGPYFNKPYEIGDHLWVRETFCYGSIDEFDAEHPDDRSLFVDQYAGRKQDPIYKQWCMENNVVDIDEVKWKPSIHMPRSASRILLEVTNVRKERLNDISEVDVVAEGGPKSHPSIDKVSRACGFEDWPRSWFAQTWDWINGNGAWSKNPYVWVIEFKVIEGVQ